MMKENRVQFILNNQLTELIFNDELNPTTTLLQFLRSKTEFKGTKEGCAEGDCGACTVVLAEFINNFFRYKAVDSCLIFLPMLHGLCVYTVEYLEKINNGNLHPVQKAIVENNGTQCGFCTPGFAMSMFALYQNNYTLQKDIIEDALSGNLCRCTGYQSIIEACLSDMMINKNENTYLKLIEDEQVNLLNCIDTNNLIIIKNSTQEYYKCFNKEQVLNLLEINDDSIIINGSTDISLLVTKRNINIPKIIDISAVKELKKNVVSSEWIKIGAGLSLEDLKDFSEKHLPILYQVLKVFASKQIRELGTIGGNVGSSSPISDLLPALMILEAEIKLQSINNSRLVNINDYVISYRKTEIKSNELITKIHIPNSNQNFIQKFYKISKRKDMDISTLSACFELKLNGYLVENFKAAYGGMDAVAKRVRKLENFIIGKSWDRNTIQKAQYIIEECFNPISDARSSADFRKIAAKNLLLKFWSETKI